MIFNGFTTVLTASAPVTPCDTYHLKIAVADGARHDDDSLTLLYNSLSPPLGLYDSGIFLKFGGLRSTDSLWAEARGGTAGDSLAPYAVRGCLPGSFRLYRDLTVNAPLTLTYTLSGTAVPGQDYTPLSGAATIPANAAYVDIPVNALTFGSGAKSLVLTLHSPYNSPCMSIAQGDIDTVTLVIYDDGVYAQITTSDTAICQGCSAQLNVNGDPNLQYNWTPITGLNNANLQNPIATPAQLTHYFMTATQPAPATCLPAKDSVWVYVGNVGIEEIKQAQTMYAAPNPFHKSFQLITKNSSRIYQVQISNVLGKKMLRLKGTTPEINRQLAVRTPAFPEGNYLLNVFNEKGKLIAALKLAKVK